MRMTFLTALMACFAFVFSPAAFGQGAASCNVTQIQIEIGIGALRGLVGGTESLGVQVHFTDGTAEAWQDINQGASWPANSTHTAVVQLSSAKPLNKIKSTLVFDKAPAGTRPWNMSFLKLTAIGNSVSAPAGAYGSFNFMVTGNVVAVYPPPGAACSPNANRVAGSVHPRVGTPVQSSGSLINEKAAQGTLLAPGAQQTLLGPSGGGTLAVNGTPPQGDPKGGTLALNGAPQRGVAAGGALAVNGAPHQGDSNGGTLKLNGAPQGGSTATASSQMAINPAGPIGPSQTMSAERNATGMPAGRQAGVSAAMPGTALDARRLTAIKENPSVYVAEVCAKDPSFRILFVTGAPDGKTLIVGPQYTVWGCSFGTPPPVKSARPARSPSQNVTQFQPSDYAVAVYSTPFGIAWFVYADIESWSDNSIVISIPASAAVYRGRSVAGMDLPAMLWVTRGDDQLRLYGDQAGQVMFKPAN